MLFSLFLVLFLPCAGMSVVFLIYICLLWYAAVGGRTNAAEEAPVTAAKGLSPADLAKIPKIAGRDLVLGNECAVCLDEIGPDQAARVVPGCNHGFHVDCADTWLLKNPVCPLCRTGLEPELLAGCGKENLC